MGRIGNRAKGSTTYLYTQGSTGSTAVGVDSTDSDKFKIYADPAAGATPETGAQFSIDPSTDGDVEVSPNGTGRLQLLNGNLDLPTIASGDMSGDNGVITVAGTRFIYARNVGPSGCTFVGKGSGNFTQTGASNTGLGQNTLPDLTTGQQNTALGNNTLEQLNTGTGNVAIGTGCLNNITTADNNTFIGRLVSGGAAFNGSSNVVIKAGATLGQVLYSNLESSNVLIQNVGVAAENNTLRIGTTGAGAGQQNRCFIGGTYGITPAGATQVVVMDSAGQMGTSATAPSPASATAFAAKLTTPVLNVTGDGTSYTVICETERFDTGANYNNATGVFTAPATGIYQFSWGILAQQFTAAFSLMSIQLVTTGGSWQLANVNPGTMFNASNNLSLSGSVLVDMTSGNTASLRITVSGSTLTIDLFGDATTNPYTYFSGFRVA